MGRHSAITALWHSFAGRIVLGGAIIHVVLIPFLFTGLLLIVAQSYKEQFVQYVRHDASQFAEHLAEATDLPHLQRHLDEIALSGHTIFAQLIFPDGKAISAATNRPAADFQEDFYFGEHKDGVYYIALPVEFGDTTVSLHLGYEESTAQEQIQSAYQRGTALALAYILLSLLLVAVIIPQLTRPLRKLRDAARKIASGRAMEHLSVKSGIHEISDLADELERMRHDLVSRSQAIAAREERIRAIMDNVVDGIITIDKSGTIESMNQAALRIFGYEPDEVVGANLDTLLDQPYFCEYQQGDAAETAPRISFTSVSAHETVGRHKDGHTFPMEIAISELTHSIADRLFIAIVRDITERKQAESEIKALQEDLEQRVIKRTRELAALNRELEHQALHDALTELPNRLLLQDRLRQAILVAQRENHPLALLITDLDRFKEINDTLGHHYGDLVLQQVAARMRGGLRESDTIARLGGDEFAVLLPMIESEQDAVNTARKLVGIMEAPIVLEDQSFHIGVSVGIALYPEHGRNGSTLMRHADVAMYVAKRSTSDFALYDAREDQHSISRLAMVSELRHAIEYKQLVVFYQPKIDLKEGRITGVEALVRWNHPQRGLLMPDDFIPLAEHTGLIRPLTFFVLEEALHQSKLWREAGLRLRIAINLSARHLQDEQLAHKVDAAMRQWEIDPALLEFEITESALMANPLRAMDTLTRLSNMGVSLSIDDFGTGYSSLIYLKQLPVDEIKIDKSFVMDMLDNNEDLVIVRATVDLSHNMGRRVVAEGVENVEVLDALVKLGCDMAQGYHISRPVTAAVLTGWLKKSQWQPGRSGTG